MAELRPAPFFIGDDLALDFLNSIAAPWGEEIEWLGSGRDLASQTPLAESQSATFADRRGDWGSRVPKGLHPCATMRRSHLHPVVPGRKQGPRTTLVQHGSVRQSGEGGGASGTRTADLCGRPVSLIRIFRFASE